MKKTKRNMIISNNVNVQEMKDRSIEERNELFDSSIREQLTGYEPTVPHALWNRISSELDNGEASGISPIAEHQEQSIFGKWKLAMAAVVILTLSVGALLYTLNPKGDTPLTSTPVANNTTKAATTSLPMAAPVHVTETKMVAQTAHIRKAVRSRSISHINMEPATAKTNEPATAPAKHDQASQDEQLALAPILTENKPVDVGNIPLSALNVKITPSVVNDEITVIRSIEKKKRHGRKNDESTKVIMIGKKYDSKPDIKYQIPVRF
jgi:hypothetical protein